MLGMQANRCDVCGFELYCGRCFDGPCDNCRKLDTCSDCKKAVKDARDQAIYLKRINAKD